MTAAFFLSVVLLALAMSFMALKIMFSKSGKFPEYRIGHNKDMHKMGISCVKHEEIKNHREESNAGCCGCGRGLC